MNEQLGPVPLSVIFEPLIEQLDGEDWQVKAPFEITEAFQTPALLAARAYDEALAQVGSELDMPDVEFIERSANWLEKFHYLLPLAAKNGVVFGIGALEPYASKSPLMAGFLGAIREFRRL